MAVHLGFPKRSPRLTIAQVPLGKIGGEPIWLREPLSVMCCEVPSHFICQILAPGDEEQAYYRYLYFFQCPHCKSPSVYRAQLGKRNQFFSEEEEQKIPAEDDWNTDTPTETIENLLVSPEVQENYCDICMEIFEEDPKVTEVARKLFTADLRNELVVTDVLESMEGNVESFSEEKISQGDEEEDDDDDDLEEFAEDKANRDVSFEVFRWFNDFHTRSPVIRYGRNVVPLWYSDRDRPGLVPSPCQCGAMRTFECQILPQIITAIKGYELDFGGIFTYTCPNSCEVQGYAVEEAFYQPSL